MTSNRRTDHTTADGQVNRPTTRFLAIPKELLSRTDLDLQAKTAYAYLLDFASMNGGQVFPGQRRIARDLGISNAAAGRWIEKLKVKGLVTVESGKGHGRRTNRYILTPLNNSHPPPEERSAHVNGAQSGAQRTPVAPRSRSSSAHVNGARSAHVNGAHRDKRHIKRQKRPAARAGPAAPAAVNYSNRSADRKAEETDEQRRVRRLLEGAGVGEPVRGELVGNGELTGELVESLRSRGLRRGALVNAVRESLENSRAEAELRERRREVAEREKTERESAWSQAQAEAEADASRLEAARLILALSPGPRVHDAIDDLLRRKPHVAGRLDVYWDELAEAVAGRERLDELADCRGVQRDRKKYAIDTAQQCDRKKYTVDCEDHEPEGCRTRSELATIDVPEMRQSGILQFNMRGQRVARAG